MATIQNEGKKAALVFGACFGIYLLIIFWKTLFPQSPPVTPIVPQDTLIPLIVTEEVVPDESEEELKSLPVNLSSELESGIIRKTQVFRGTDYSENVFYENGKEIARQTISPDGSIDQQGQIPDGTIKFEDSYNNTHGEETYIDGKKFGIAKTHYPDGNLKSEAKYFNDKLVTIKEYFANGTLRSDVNYEDARTDDIESGIGKLYAADGRLKFEWNLTNNGATGYKKSYNKDGSLRAATYFDHWGKILREERPPIE